MGELESLKGVRHCTVELEKKKEKQRKKNSTSVPSVCCVLKIPKKPNLICVSGKLIFKTPKWQNTFTLKDTNEILSMTCWVFLE